MKSVLVFAAALGLSATGALADCAGHVKTTASVDVDRTTTASIAGAEQNSADQVAMKAAKATAPQSDIPAETE